MPSSSARRAAFFVFPFVVVFAGCATTGTAVQQTAGQTLACPNDSIRVKRIDHHTYVATGCGSSVEVLCYDPYESTGAARAVFDGTTAGNRVHCETLLAPQPSLTAAIAAPSTTPSAASFDKPLAAKLLSASADRVARSCGARGGPIGEGHARVTFSADGSVTNVDPEPPFRDTDVGACVSRELARTSLPAFDGGPITVRKSFSIAPTEAL
jgi:hypothetical protein